MEAPDPDDPNPIDDAELLLYTTPLSDGVDEDAVHDTLLEMELVSASLWARFDDEFELPLWAVSPAPVWLSPFPDEYSGDAAGRVSEAFIDGVAAVVDEDAGGWGHVPEDLLESMSDLETRLIADVRQSFLELGSSSPAMVIEWCVERSEYGPNESDGSDDSGEE